MTQLALLIVNYNTWALCAGALRSFAGHAPTAPDGTPMSWRPIVVDNASPNPDPEAEQEVADLCEQFGGVLVRHDENAGYSKGMNLALSHAGDAEWLLVSNPDVKYCPTTVDPLLRAMEADPRIGCAMPAGFFDRALIGRLPPNILPTMRDLIGNTLGDLFPKFCLRYSRKRTREAVRVWTATETIDLSMLSGACFLMHRSFVEQIGFFDERFPLYYEDTDLSVRVKRAGKRIVQVAGSDLVHYYDRSGQTNHEEKMRRYWASKRLYYRKWYGRIGALIYDVCRNVLESRWGRRRRQINPQPQVTDLGAGHSAPTIRLDRPRKRFLVEFALDPKFFLAAGVLAEGDQWRPTVQMMSSFGPTTYWFRGVDLDDPAQPVLAVWRYTLKFPVEEHGEGVDSPAATKQEPDTDRPGSGERAGSEARDAEIGGA